MEDYGRMTTKQSGGNVLRQEEETVYIISVYSLGIPIGNVSIECEYGIRM